MPLFRGLFLGFLLALMTAAAPAFAAERTPLILISIDGFRVEYLQRGLTPTLSALAAEGARAEAMRPSYPVNTFPNHYTLVTGLRPDRHGLIDNNMFDPARPGVKFHMGARDQVSDRFWWDGGEPIWVAAERRGVKTATLFWPGSETDVRGVRPSIWFPYAKSMPYADRVDRLLGWLDLPAADRPALMTLYFEAVDTQGHNHGPHSPEVEVALAETDAALARLVAGLKARGLYEAVNIVVVSDHGMTDVSPERVIFLDEVLPPETFEAITVGSMAGVRPADAEAERRLLQPHERFRCWRKAEIAARLQYGRHVRVPPVFCQADSGWIVTTRARWAAWPLRKPGGAHGFDPLDPDMQAIFVARGPAIRPGVVLPPFDNVSVYPLLARLLDVPPASNDGRIEDTAAALR